VGQPLTSVVGSLAAWVAALAVTGEMPRKRRIVALVTPKPMPRVPSTNCARPPARAKAARTNMDALLSN
jgi:hypothetical protein